MTTRIGARRSCSITRDGLPAPASVARMLRPFNVGPLKRTDSVTRGAINRVNDKATCFPPPEHYLDQVAACLVKRASLAVRRRGLENRHSPPTRASRSEYLRCFLKSWKYPVYVPIVISYTANYLGRYGRHQ